MMRSLRRCAAASATARCQACGSARSATAWRSPKAPARQADSGQYLLDLEVSVSGGQLSVLAREPARDAEHWFERGAVAEATQPAAALTAYERALALDPDQVAARVNLGRVLHETGQFDAAEHVYREGLRYTGTIPFCSTTWASCWRTPDGAPTRLRPTAPRSSPIRGSPIAITTWG
jgi:tetratricopeptide (TPR) repeat protein